MTNKTTIKELLLEFGITSEMISKATYDLENAGYEFWQNQISYSPDEKNLLLLKRLFPEKIFSEEEKKILIEMIDYPYVSYLMGSKEYEEAFEFSKKFPEIWKFAKEVVNITNIVWERLNRKIEKSETDFIINLCSDPIIKKIVITEKINFFWENIISGHERIEDFIKDLKEIIKDPMYKDYFIHWVAFEITVKDTLSF
ncbi:MAG: hypothetical protein WA101_00345 [Minisyncoccia bacterium]